MTYELTKIEVECWRDEDFKRFLKEDYPSYGYEDLKEWVSDEVSESDYDKTLEQACSDICTNGGGYDVWTDFRLYYADIENNRYCTLTYTNDGELMEIDDCGEIKEKNLMSRCDLKVPIKDILTVNKPQDF